MLAKELPITLRKFAENPSRFSGLASTFGDVDRHGDAVMRGAYRETLAAWARRSVPMPVLWQHGEQVGVVTRAEETERGLEVDGELIDGTESADLARRLLALGGLGMSIGFQIMPGGARLRDDGIRELTRLDLAEVSLVSTPANAEAYAIAAKASAKNLERLARDVLGLSAREAKRLAAGGFSALVRDEPADDTEQLRKAAEADAERMNYLLNRIANFKGTP